MAVVGAPARAGEYHLGPFCTSMLATLDSLHQGVLAADFFDHLPRAHATIECVGTNRSSACLLGSIDQQEWGKNEWIPSSAGRRAAPAPGPPTGSGPAA